MSRALRTTMSTREAAEVMGRNPGRFREWAATELDVQPLRRTRIGRSWVTVWSRAELTEALRARHARQGRSWGAQMATLPVECPTSEVA